MMKRKLIVCIICLFLASLLISPAWASASLSRIVDDAGLLTADETQLLEDAAYEFRDMYGLDAVILTVDDLGGRSIASFADDFYDYQGYGVGSEYSGLILVVAMAERELYISTCGEAIQRLNDRELDEIIGAVSSELSNGNYYDAFQLFFGFTILSVDFDAGQIYYEEEAGINWLLSILIGTAAAGIAVAVMAGSMNTKRRQHSAGSYLREGSYDLKNRQDIFLYSNVSKVRREQNSGSRGGGTSVHRSSSGRSHGGRGGRF